LIQRWCRFDMLIGNKSDMYIENTRFDMVKLKDSNNERLLPDENHTFD